MKPFTCDHCQRELCRTDGQQLIFGVVIAGEWKVISRIRPKARTDVIKVICECGRVRSWQREAKTIDAGKQACYSNAVPV